MQIARQNTPHVAAAEGACVCVRAAYRIAGGELDTHSTLVQRVLLLGAVAALSAFSCSSSAATKPMPAALAAAATKPMPA
jgi:hypothetical protein